MYNGRQAYDKYSGNPVSDLTAQSAADNPMMFKWVEWR